MSDNNGTGHRPYPSRSPVIQEEQFYEDTSREDESRSPPPSFGSGRSGVLSGTSISTPASPLYASGHHRSTGSFDWRAVGSRSSRPSVDISNMLPSQPSSASSSSHYNSPVTQLPMALNEAIGFEDPREGQRSSLSAPPPFQKLTSPTQYSSMSPHSMSYGQPSSPYQSAPHLPSASSRAYSVTAGHVDPSYYPYTMPHGMSAPPYMMQQVPRSSNGAYPSYQSFHMGPPPHHRRHSVLGGNGATPRPPYYPPGAFVEELQMAPAHYGNIYPPDYPVSPALHHHQHGQLRASFSSGVSLPRSSSHPDFSNLAQQPTFTRTHPSFQLSTYRGCLFTVEFKAARTELFYILEIDGVPTMDVQPGDFVIVEADRGEDLGKVTSKVSLERLKKLLSCMENPELSQKDIEPELVKVLSSTKEIVPKRIHRQATLQDLRQMQSKAQEEAIAMIRCQSRIRQKRLPMELVDAEYQWDHNKLTFYFVADRRIDFRDLVKELFRAYKTRIWMCAVDRSRPSNPVLKDGVYEGQDINELVRQEDAAIASASRIDPETMREYVD